MDMSGPMTSMAAMRSFRRDPSVVARELPKGTVRRILGIARPYRRDLTWFVLLVVGSSVIGVLTPLLAGQIVNRIASLHGTTGDIVRIALLIAGLAVLDAGISLATRWFSARIGEGVIYDLRCCWCRSSCSPRAGSAGGCRRSPGSPTGSTPR